MVAHVETREFGKVLQIRADGRVNVLQKIFDGVRGKFGGRQFVFVEVFGGKIFVGNFFGVKVREGAPFKLEVGKIFQPLKKSRLTRD